MNELPDQNGILSPLPQGSANYVMAKTDSKLSRVSDPQGQGVSAAHLQLEHHPPRTLPVWSLILHEWRRHPEVCSCINQGQGAEILADQQGLEVGAFADPGAVTLGRSALTNKVLMTHLLDGPAQGLDHVPRTGQNFLTLLADHYWLLYFLWRVKDTHCNSSLQSVDYMFSCKQNWLCYHLPYTTTGLPKMFLPVQMKDSGIGFGRFCC